MTYAPEVLTALVAVRELISVPERWTQGVPARDAKGRKVGCSDPDAVCFCLLGAICHCSQDEYARSKAEWVLNYALGIGNYVFWQDEYRRTHAEVLTVVDRAIVIAGGAQ